MRALLKCTMLAALLLVVASIAVADPLPGRDFVKFSQVPMIQTLVPGPTGEPGIYYGHDELSTVWWDGQTPPDDRLYHGVFMADDFADPFARPVVHVKWWGSYMGQTTMRQVERFAIVFEKDVSKEQAIEDPNDPYNFSHPDCTGFKHSQVSVRDSDGALSPMEGTFTERLVLGSNPAELVYEYNAELRLPFEQQPDTVYWLKIIALSDDYIEDPNRLQWGWHNRDYTIRDPLASVPPQVWPGERDQGPLYAGTPFETPIWHFQDDAVGGDVINVHVNNPTDVHMDQDHWVTPQGGSMFAAMYVDGADGPDGIEQYSKDLAFELFSYTYIPGDANHDGRVDKVDAATLAAHWGQSGVWEDGDFDADGMVGPADASIMAGNWGYGTSEASNVPEPSALVLLGMGALGLLACARRQRK